MLENNMLDFWINEDLTVTWFGAIGQQTDGTTVPLNSATITYELKTRLGVLVTGGSGSLTYIPGSDGDYIGTIEHEVTALLIEGEVYFLELTLDQSPYNGFRRRKGEAKYHG